MNIMIILITVAILAILALYYYNNCESTESFQSQANEWHSVGCWNDNIHRAMPVRLYGNYNVQQCQNAALNAGANTCALQNGDACFIGNSPYFSKYGASHENCEPRGGKWINHVYIYENAYQPENENSLISHEPTLQQIHQPDQQQLQRLQQIQQEQDVLQERLKIYKNAVINLGSHIRNLEQTPNNENSPVYLALMRDTTVMEQEIQKTDQQLQHLEQEKMSIIMPIKQI